ncbi:2-hydroxyacid dehydrogenase [Agaricicola taiwanensis]|uniref:2-hydroxyacid dehydrogenase n=1 Tax=Agaricicola taiwanensis TaxID=591372 RepID=A0A8J2YGJ4_9RHOB|nr:D-2-hydroxyacid dehydrogenase family protein [Agaricicola taiwanensis]GGE35636.1 2-hydroxyacid dehydrogenase [Agaricicola taiwanensis]
MRIAVLDDYQGLTHSIVDWSRVPDVTIVPFTDHVHDEDQLVARLQDFDGVMRIRERTEFPRRVLERLPKLKLLLATGMRNKLSIDLDAAKELGITVTTTEAIHSTTVEVTWALILSLMRHLPQETASLRAGGWQIGLGRSCVGKTLAVLGLGNMGTPVAQIGKLLGMEVIAWSPNLTPERTAPYGIECVSKADLFSRADVLTIHIPLADATRNIVSAEDIGRMKETAYLINTSRPALVDQTALVTALKERKIGGAGLDVFPVEPLPKDDPFRHLPNVVATPHIGFVVEQNYKLFYEQSLENLEAFLKGKPIRLIGGADAPPNL